MPFNQQDFDEIMQTYKDNLVAQVPNAKISEGSFPIKTFKPMAHTAEALWEDLANVREANLVSYAVGSELDDLASNYNFLRKDAVMAEVLLKFTGVLGTLIPSGTVVQNDANLNETILQFQTLSNQNHAFLTASTIAFSDSNPDEISDSGSGFITAGLSSGDKILVEGSVSNDGVYTIDTVVAGLIVLVGTDLLTNEVAGANITITKLIEAESVEGGEQYNVSPGILTIIQNSISGITDVSNPQSASGGIDQEPDGDIFRGDLDDSELSEGETNEVDTSTFRGRLINYLRNNTGKTTKSGYENTALTVAGVATAQAINFSTNPPLIYLIPTVSTGNGIPTVGQIADIQTVMDLDENKDPLDTVLVVAPIAVPLTIEYTITLEVGADFGVVSLSITDRINSYMNNLKGGQDVLVIHLDNIVHDTDGVDNFTRTLPVSDTVIAYNEKGTVASITIL